jgi:carbonic anhydrase
VDQAGSDPEAAIRANARIQAGILRSASPVIAGLAAQGKVKVVAAYYDLAIGTVTLLVSPADSRDVARRLTPPEDPR